MKNLLVLVLVTFLISCGGTESSEQETNNNENTNAEGAALGEACDSETSCQADLICSNLCGAGTCIDLEAEEALCEAENGMLVTNGLCQNIFCEHPYPDGGLPCTDGDQCQGGMCLLNEETNTGECKRTDDPFGCFLTIENGEPSGGFCVD